MRFILILILLLPKALFAQVVTSPFDYGQSEEVYFMCSKERDSLQLWHIYEHYEREYTGGMHEKWDLTILQFVTDWEEHDFEMDWYIRLDTIGVDTIEFENSPFFVNGSALQFDSGFVAYSGGYGYGTMVETIFESHPKYRQGVSNYVRNSEGFFFHRVYYQNNRPSKIYYYEGDSLSYFETFEGERNTKAILDSLSAFPVDSSFLFYDEKGRFINRTKSRKPKNLEVFYKENPAVDLGHYPYYLLSVKQGYEYESKIGDLSLAQLMLNHMGYVPNVLIIEVYQNAALVFRFDSNRKQYHFTDYLFLEN